MFKRGKAIISSIFLSLIGMGLMIPQVFEFKYSWYVFFILFTIASYLTIKFNTDTKKDQ